MLENVEYGDVRLPEWPWPDIHPCPVTGCWLYTGSDFPAVTNSCGQSACCNPDHAVDQPTYSFR
jgi:hypothetical protein